MRSVWCFWRRYDSGWDYAGEWNKEVAGLNPVSARIILSHCSLKVVDLASNPSDKAKR